MIDETARERFESFLNGEIAATEVARQAEVDFWIKGVPEALKRTNALKDTDPQRLQSYLKSRGGLIYLRTAESCFVDKGSHQAVVDVGNNTVVKFPIGHSGHVRDFMNNQFPNQAAFGEGSYRFMKETVENLRGLGFKVPDVDFYRVHWSEDGRAIVVDRNISHNGYVRRIKQAHPSPNAYFVPDLREGDRFSVLDYEDGTALSLPNGETIKLQFQEAYAKLAERAVVCRVGISEGVKGKNPPYLINAPHGPDYTPDTAIRKMFLLQVPANPGEDGRLVLGDFDHIMLFNI